MKTRLYAALMLLGFLLLTACGGGDDPQTYNVGDTGPAGGIVFSITDGGQHGLEYAPDILGPVEWGCDGSAILDDLNNPINGTGQSNTKHIVDTCLDNGGTSYAAKLANDYVLNSHNDWYLPNKDNAQLALSIKYGTTSNTLLSVSYWTSSQDTGSPNAWADVAYVDGIDPLSYSIISDPKSVLKPVLPVRGF